jgi:uncharacterized lipoprotein YddW (UPF0748 family)
MAERLLLTLVALLAGVVPACAQSAPAAPGSAPVPAAAAAPREVRAVWYNFYRLSPLRAAAEPVIASHVESLRRMGVNRIYVLIKTPDGFASYDSRKLSKWWGMAPDPADPKKKRRTQLDWDPFAFLLKSAGAAGIEVWPYINVFCEGAEDEEDRKRNPLLTAHPDWAVVNRKGERVGWASPAIPGVVDHELAVIREILTRYDVPGIQLDRIRLPSGEEADKAPVDYNPLTLQQFRAKHKRPKDAMPDDNDPDWVKFRQDGVTNFVKSARREAKAARPGARLSAAVFPNPTTAARNQFQDWGRWVREGLLDEVCTMAYDPKPESWEAVIAVEEAAVAGKIPMIAGIGALKFGEPSQLAGHIGIVRRRGLAGYIFFNAYSLFEKPGFPEALAELNR